MSNYKNYNELNKKKVMSITESCKEFPVPPKSDKSYVCNKKQYKEIMELYMKKLTYYMITTGDVMVLPSRLGVIRIYRYNTDRLHRNLKEMNIKIRKFIDFNKTKKLKESGINKTVTMNNMSTYGYWFKVKWTKFKHANFKNKSFYSFKPLRTVVRHNTQREKDNNNLTIVNFFREKGWTMYSDLPNNINNNTKLK